MLKPQLTLLWHVCLSCMRKEHKCTNDMSYRELLRNNWTMTSPLFFLFYKRKSLKWDAEETPATPTRKEALWWRGTNRIVIDIEINRSILYPFPPWVVLVQHKTELRTISIVTHAFACHQHMHGKWSSWSSMDQHHLLIASQNNIPPILTLTGLGLLSEPQNWQAFCGLPAYRAWLSFLEKGFHS